MGRARSALAVLVLLAGTMVAPLVAAAPAAATEDPCPNGVQLTLYPQSASLVPYGAPAGSYYGITIQVGRDRITGDYCGEDAYARMLINGGPHWGDINVYLQGCYVGPTLMQVPNDGVEHRYNAPPGTDVLCNVYQATAKVYGYYGSTQVTPLAVTA